MGFGNRLKHIIDYYKITKKDFAAKCGVSNNQIFNYINEDQEPSAKFFRNLKQLYPMVDLNWLLIGEGEMKITKKPLKSTMDDNELLLVTIEAVEKIFQRRNLSIKPLKKALTITTIYRTLLDIGGIEEELDEETYNHLVDLISKKKG